MNFNDNKPIYLQVAQLVSERIITGTYTERIPGIREIAAELQVNPNTVQRSYDFMESSGIITVTRGVGYFVHDKSIREIKKYKKDEFLKNELPAVFRTMEMLDMEETELNKYFQLFKQKKFPK
ncbi:MAG: GntR family transcriptional regulator [Flavobacteriales bacterium]